MTVYFFNDEERKFLLRGLVPRSRALDLAEDLRGWNWHHPPLEPPHDIKLGVYEVAGRYCPTGRDLYARRVLSVRGTPNHAMLCGSFYHAVLVEVLIRAKRLLYIHGVQDYREALTALAAPDHESLSSDIGGKLPPEERDEVLRRGAILWAFESDRISARVQEVLSRHPYINVDALVSLAVPVVVEQKLNGSFLGLSPNLSADAVLASEPLIVDLKFGEPRDFHRLSTTGYAMAMEAIYEYPVNIGCLVYADFRDNRWVIRKDFHVIDEELRQWFIEERDEKMRIVFEEMDPGRAAECPATCAYFGWCRGGEDSE